MENLEQVYKRRAWLIENFEALRTVMSHTQEFKEYYHGKERSASMDTTASEGRVKFEITRRQE